jgi:uncharacterized protein YabE (DUF348 family)
MKQYRGLIFLYALLLLACQPVKPSTITIVDNDKVITLQTEERVPSVILNQAGITLDQKDRVLANGKAVSLDQAIESFPITIQIRRAKTLTLLSPNAQSQIRSSAFTVGEALAEVSYEADMNYQVIPPLNTPLQEGMTITVKLPHALTIHADEKTLQIQSSAETVGQALAEAGIPLAGQDYSLPSENEALPPNGEIRVVRVKESVVLAQKPIPYESEFVASADILLDQTQLMDPGENGLMMQRIRIRYEDGQEVSRATESEVMVRPPKNRVLAYGTKIEIKTAVVDGVTIEYWRAVQMFATSFSPCQLGVPGLCSNITASGLRLVKGVVGMKRSWYTVMHGQQFYIPGYGHGVLGDLGAGYPDGRPHIDLGYTDEDYVAWHHWVTIYFLTPVPDSIIYVLK